MQNTQSTDLQGEARTRVLTHWCQLLQQLHPKNLPANQLYSLSSLPPGSPHAGRSDNDWQQLHVARVEPATPKLAVSVPAHALSRPHQPAASAASDITTKSHSSDRNATGSGAEFWTNQVLYIGQLQEHEEQELLTFRELFLQSYALENIIVGMSMYTALAETYPVSCPQFLASVSVTLLHVSTCVFHCSFEVLR